MAKKKAGWLPIDEARELVHYVLGTIIWVAGYFLATHVIEWGIGGELVGKVFKFVDFIVLSVVVVGFGVEIVEPRLKRIRLFVDKCRRGFRVLA